MPGWLRRLFREDETHFVELVKHFFHLFFENDFISQRGEARLTVVHVLALLAVPPILYTFYIIPLYDDIKTFFPWQYQSVTLIDQCRYVTFSMVVIGIVAVLEWDALFLDGRDYAVLSPLPLRAPAIFLAKITALLLFISLFIVGVGGITSVFYPLVESTAMQGPQAPPLVLLHMVLAHAVAVSSGAAFVFLFFVAVQGLFITFLRPRAFKIVSLGVQVGAMVALLLTLFLLPITSDGLPAWAQAPTRGFFWDPLLWFVGLYRTLLGTGEAVFHTLARTAVIALGLVTLACAAGYIASYRRLTQLALEASEAPATRASRLAGAARRGLNRLLLPKPLERATFFFVVSTLARSTKHRLYLAAYVGVGFALATFGILEVLAHTVRRDFGAFLLQPTEPLLAIPLILSFFLLSGMRVVFTLPAELPANWIFQLTENEKCADCWSGTRKAMLVPVVELFLCLFPVYTFLWGWAKSLEHLTFDLMLSLILVELLLMNFRKIPFACSYQPGKANITVLGAFYWFAYTTYAYTMATLER